MKFLNLDSPFMRFLSRMTDLLWLNILTAICCIPIFTIGASLTAMHYVCLKLIRGEEGYVSNDFFKSFKKNFAQATAIWMIFLAVIVIITLDIWYLFTSGLITGGMWLAVAAGIFLTTIFVLFTLIFVFPVLSHFENTVKGTIKNSFLMGIVSLPKTVAMLFLYILPLFLLYYAPQIIPLTILFWFTVPGYLSAMLYNRIFKKYEPEETETIVDDFSWTVQADEEE